MSDYTMRELVATTLNSSTALRDLGLAENQVWDADTVDAPDSLRFPFIVIRWQAKQAGLAHVWRHPFYIWVYMQQQDRTVAEKMASAAMAELVALEPQEKFDGFLMHIEDKGQGDDLWDESFKAMVVPRQGLAIGSGV